MFIYVCIYVCIYIHMYIHIYIYMEEERDEIFELAGRAILDGKVNYMFTFNDSIDSVS
jgi:hypothetical protein